MNPAPPDKRAMGIDLGEARVGVAVADTLGMLAHPRETIKVGPKGDKAVVARIVELVRADKIAVVVLGLPRNMNGTEGPAAAKARAFADKLRAATGCEVRLQDERLSTVAAHKALQAGGRNAKQGRAVIDQAAAQIILQTYLDAQAFRQTEPPPDDLA